jgi:hypothetical protein
LAVENALEELLARDTQYRWTVSQSSWTVKGLLLCLLSFWK